MSLHVTANTLEFLNWVADRPRTYDEAMEAWRTSCPRLSVWEDSIIDGLVCLERSIVTLTPRGRETLDALRPAARR